MTAIYGLNTQRNTGKVAIVRALRDTVVIGGQTFYLNDLNPTVRKFNNFWDMMDTVNTHGYLRSAMSVIGRSTIGAWWSLRKKEEFGGPIPNTQKNRLMNFYMFKNRQWDNIKDFHTIAYKLMIGAMYLRFFGQASYQIVRDAAGSPMGLDFIPGLVIPNVDSGGFFKEPAFFQFPVRDLSKKIEFRSPRDIVYVINPDFEGSPMGGSDIEALTELTLPLDFYLMVAAREYMKNRDKPEVVYQLPSDISDESFEEFVEEMKARHGGAANLGRSPIAVQGEFDIKELRPLPDSLPYQDSRGEAREEEMAAAGVNAAKLGLSSSLSSANLREMRREFHETSMLPLFKFIELAFYEQIHVREFNHPGWEFRFNAPDFLNAVEKATVHMRYHDIGALNPNEIRYEIGREPREGGDEYVDTDVSEAQPGSPPEGREEEPDSPSETGEPTLDDQDPPRGDQHDEETRTMVIGPESVKELKNWWSFCKGRIRRGKTARVFRTEWIPDELHAVIQERLEEDFTLENVNAIFGEVFEYLDR